MIQKWELYFCPSTFIPGNIVFIDSRQYCYKTIIVYCIEIKMTIKHWPFTKLFISPWFVLTCYVLNKDCGNIFKYTPLGLCASFSYQTMRYLYYVSSFSHFKNQFWHIEGSGRLSYSRWLGSASPPRLSFSTLLRLSTSGTPARRSTTWGGGSSVTGA